LNRPDRRRQGNRCELRPRNGKHAAYRCSAKSQGANVYDILRRDVLVLTKEAVNELTEKLKGIRENGCEESKAKKAKLLNGCMNIISPSARDGKSTMGSEHGQVTFKVDLSRQPSRKSKQAVERFSV
jgi:hypothetical protein